MYYPSWKCYSGIGSRKTPPEYHHLISSIASELALMGYCLRSGAASGTDSWFEEGCDSVLGAKEIYLPWKLFNHHPSSLLFSPLAMHIASKYHPRWESLIPTVKKLHSRNVHQVLGRYCKNPSCFVICYSPGTGGTEMALRIAKSYGIQIVNLIDYSPFINTQEIVELVEIKRHKLKKGI